ncbi:GNAT family N-acetyltransferase [Desulfobotulus sp.]|uniref:GNAT family N-acetyltransferase n=1 Tax=Desulfobotulus sp. TaxID=1940337 RepID=UPI002A3711AF|nr:GNAT family N-acetyltransferase [Desulfobotulus sp.]MDY0163808.1 GNAT family N-acetyltransferase [Desulfobotulus sp.]
MNQQPCLQIETPRLRLVAVSPQLLEAETQRYTVLSTMLDAEIPEGWPPPSLIPLKPWFREQIFLHPEKTGWFLWYGILRRALSDVLILSTGFLEPPDIQGGVEIGYALMDPWRGQGLATEAALALVDWAFLHPEVRFIRARIARGNLASGRILKRCGFEHTDPDPLKPAIDRYIRYR